MWMSALEVVTFSETILYPLPPIFVYWVFLNKVFENYYNFPSLLLPLWELQVLTTFCFFSAVFRVINSKNWTVIIQKVLLYTNRLDCVGAKWKLAAFTLAQIIFQWGHHNDAMWCHQEIRCIHCVSCTDNYVRRASLFITHLMLRVKYLK